MPTPLVLTIDVGTSSMRAVVWSAKGRPRFKAQCMYRPNYQPAGIVEQDADIWLRALIQLTSKAVDFASQSGIALAGVSLTAQRSSVIAVDRIGTPLSPAMMWQDQRSQSICNSISDSSREVYERCGARPNPVFLGPKISWLRYERESLYKQAHKLVAIPDLLMFCMTGLFVTDRTYGCRTLLMNLVSGEWDDHLLRLFAVNSSKLSTLIDQGNVAGHTTSAFHTLTGLSAGTPVISAGGDQQCAALGAGIFKEGQALANTGTGSFLIAASDSIKLHAGMGIACGCSAIPGQYILEASILATAAIYNWFNQQFFADANYRQINHAAASSPVGSKGLIILPHFNGRGSPDWNHAARGVFYNFTLGSTRADMARAILEGIAIELAENIDVLESLIPTSFEVIASGGLTKAEVFNQIQADMYQRSVTTSPHSEASSFGAWISAAVALGLVSDHLGAWKMGTQGRSVMTYQPAASSAPIYSRLKQSTAELYARLYQNC